MIYVAFNSLVDKKASCAPPGIFNETHFFRKQMLSRKNKSMLKSRTSGPWGPFGGHLGFSQARIAKNIILHNFGTKSHRKTNDTIFPYNSDMRN